MNFSRTAALLAKAQEALTQRKPEQAFECLNAYLSHQPNHVQAWFFLGAAYDQSNQIVEAEQAFAKCCELDPTHVQGWNAQGSMLIKLGKTEPAIAAFQRALVIDPSNTQILTNIGIALEKTQRHQEALQHYSRALEIDPRHLGALNNRGALLLLCGLKEDALRDHLRFSQSAPDDITGHHFCAEVYATLNLDEEALSACETALSIDPLHASSLFTRAVTLSCLQRWEEAEQAFKNVQKNSPETLRSALDRIGMTQDIWNDGIPVPRNIYFLRQQDRIKECNWDQYDSFISVLKESIQLWEESADEWQLDSNIAHTTLALPLTQKEHACIARSAAIGIKVKKQASEKTISRIADVKNKTEKLRIAYVSPDFREHATAHLTKKLYRLHDREKFQIYGYALHSDIKSKVIRDEIAAGCDVFRDLSKCVDEEINAHIQQDKIDILIDLAGYTAHARPALFTEHSAPISAAYLGYAGSIGHDGIDYYISDNVICSQEQQRFYSEQIVTLPRASFCYNDQQNIAPPQARAAYGLPENAFVFCCFNNAWKLEPQIFSVWMQLLQRVPDSMMWLYKPTAAVEKNLRAEAVKRGVDPDRLIFAPTLPVEQHLARYQVADLFLDTYYYGGHTTSMDALWAGLPLLARPGSTNASRVSTSHLLALDLSELVTDSEEAYEELAYTLANDKERLHSIRSKLARNRQEKSLFKTDDLVRNLERAYHAMWQRHQAGLPPAPIHLS